MVGLANESKTGTFLVVPAPKARAWMVTMDPLGDAKHTTALERAILEDLPFQLSDRMRLHTTRWPGAQNQVPEVMLYLWNQAHRREAGIAVIFKVAFVPQEKE